jgi:hypothetical protein
MAYSLRRVRTGYAGFAIRVRRSSDNAEQDIGFTPNAILDTAALLTFVGANDGFVTTWYDQSLNSGRNLTQTTAANQPRIVVAGALQTLNSRPVVLFDGVNSFMDVAAPIGLGAITAVLNANDVGTFGDFDGIFGGQTTANWTATGASSTVRDVNAVGTPVINGTSSVEFAPLATLKVLTANTALIAAEPTGWRLGQDRGTTTRRWNGNFAEVVAYPAVLSTANRQLLERNQGNYYGITVA